MKNFEDFKKSMPAEKLNAIYSARAEKVLKELKNIEFQNPMDEFNCAQRNQTVGLIFDFLEEYHKWLNG